jgi:hypothetical protein
MEITSGKTWRTGTPTMLPSGNVAALRRPSVFTLVADDDAPDFLKRIVIENINGRKKTANGKDEFEITAENLPQLTRTLEKVCMACFASPRIVEHPEAEDEISIADVSDGDRIAVFQWLIGGRLEAAQTFPAQQVGDVPALPDGDGVQPAPIANGGNKT